MSFSRPISDVLTPPSRRLVLGEQTGEFNHLALVQFPIERSLDGDGPVWDALRQWVLGVRVGLTLRAATVSFRDERKDAVAHER